MLDSETGLNTCPSNEVTHLGVHLGRRSVILERLQAEEALKQIHYEAMKNSIHDCVATFLLI